MSDTLMRKRDEHKKAWQSDAAYDRGGPYTHKHGEYTKWIEGVGADGYTGAIYVEFNGEALRFRVMWNGNHTANADEYFDDIESARWQVHSRVVLENRHNGKAWENE